MANVWIGAIPPHIISKAKSAIKSPLIIGNGWKKLNGIQNCLAFRLNNNYRVLCWQRNEFIVCDHDTYEKKIKILRSKRGRNANCI